MGYDLRHDRHTVSLLTDHLVFSPKYRGEGVAWRCGRGGGRKYSVSCIAKRIKGRSSKLLRDRFQQLKEWCPSQFYDEAGDMPVVVIDKAKGKTHKTGYITLHTKFFKGGDVYNTSQNGGQEKSKSFYIYPRTYL